jgi:hypothetical protein
MRPASEQGRIAAAFFLSGAAPLMPGAAYVAQEAGGRAPRVITDLNLVPEYRHGSGLALPALQPLLPADAGPWAGPRR